MWYYDNMEIEGQIPDSIDVQPLTRGREGEWRRDDEQKHQEDSKTDGGESR